MEFIKYVVAEFDAAPGFVLPGKAGVENFGWAVNSLRLEAGSGIGALFAGREAIEI